MTFARAVFIMTAVPFTLLSASWLFLDAGTSQHGNGWVFALCGGTFIYGSIFSLKGELPLGPFVLIGLILNIIGGVIWMPALIYSFGSSVGFIGAGLAALWIKAIHSAYCEESR